MIEINHTGLKGVLLIRLSAFEDFRGKFYETYNESLYHEKGISAKFLQDDISVSSRHVLRGIHGDNVTWKLMSCLQGNIYLVVVNCDPDSGDFGKWQSFTLSDTNGIQVLVPPKYGNAHLVLSNKAILHYKQSTYYDPAKQFSYRYDDSRFAIWWPIAKPILSPRDEAGRYV